MYVGGSAQVVDKTAGGQLSHLITGIIDGGKIGLHYGRDRVVIKADEGDVFGDADTHLPEGYHATHGAVVVGDEYGVGEWFHGPDLGGCFGALLLAEVAHDHVVIAESDTIIGKGFFVPF